MFVVEVKPNVILNSRKERTIEISLKTHKGKFKASAPSGKSKGKHEVPAWNIKGVEESYRILKVFCKSLNHRNFSIKKIDDLKEVHKELRRFETTFGMVGGNSIYVLETVFLKAAAAENGMELWEFVNHEMNEGLKPKMPMPVGNCVGGGLHSKKIDGKRPDFQEFLLIPRERTFAKAVAKNLGAYEDARKILKAKRRNDENAWETSKTNEEILEVLKKIAKKRNLRIGLDVAASTFYSRGYYKYQNKELVRDKLDQVAYLDKLIKKYGVFYIEDGFQEEDFSGFKSVLSDVKKARKSTLIVGDDLTVTNPARVRRAISSKAMNAMIVKANQVGSILEVKKVVELCKKNKIKMIFSHRSGETMDDSLADYAVGFGANFIKCGIYGRERLIKMKRIMDIERGLD